MHYKCLSVAPCRIKVQRFFFCWTHNLSLSRQCSYSTFKYCDLFNSWRFRFYSGRPQSENMAITYLTKTGGSVNTQKLQRSYATTALLPGTNKKPPQVHKVSKTVPRRLPLRYCNKNIYPKRLISSCVRDSTGTFCDKLKLATWRQGFTRRKTSVSKEKTKFNSALFVSGADRNNVALVDVDLGLDQLLEDIEKVQENLKRRNIDINIYKFVSNVVMYVKGIFKVNFWFNIIKSNIFI